MSSPQARATIEQLGQGRPVAFRRATVLTVDPAQPVIENGDVLVTGDRIAAVGPALTVPDGTVEIDAAGGMLMPGMIDTHRHMWQIAQRGQGADWSLTNYFYFYYVNWGHVMRPEEVYAGNLLSAIESVDAGVTTTLDWSHGLRTIDHGEAALDALQAVPGRFVLAYGNLAQAPWEWTTSPEFRSFIDRRLTGLTGRDGLTMPGRKPCTPTRPPPSRWITPTSTATSTTTHRLQARARPARAGPRSECSGPRPGPASRAAAGYARRRRPAATGRLPAGR